MAATISPMEKLPANGSDPFQTCKDDPPKAATSCKLAKASSRGRRPFVSTKLLAAKGRGLVQGLDGFLQNGETVCKV